MVANNSKNIKKCCYSAGPKMTTEDNGNIGGILKPTSSSNEDLSEYTDADESISAPTEFLAEVCFASYRYYLHYGFFLTCGLGL